MIIFSRGQPGFLCEVAAFGHSRVISWLEPELSRFLTRVRKRDSSGSNQLITLLCPNAATSHKNPGCPRENIIIFSSNYCRITVGTYRYRRTLVSMTNIPGSNQFITLLHPVSAASH